MISEPHEHSVIAVYYSHHGAQAAVRALDRSGFDLKRLSVIGTDIPSEERRMRLGRAPAGKFLLVARAPGEMVAGARATLATPHVASPSPGHARTVPSDPSASRGQSSSQT